MSRPARCLMVWGCTSGAGKSWLATALCRWYRRQGLTVRPFKAQNMSNNARVADGGEIGAAQYFQALACGAVPDVRMNPLLLKPEADTRSQVVLLGRADAALSALPWRERGPRVWPAIAQALDALRAECDLVVIEGAGSPAEINLMDADLVNLRTAGQADARALLVADIDRGGAFAHLWGTWSLLPPAQRARLAGFVLNRFRGDAALLAPGPQQLQQMTGVPTVGVIPLVRGHGLPDEDGWSIEAASPRPWHGGAGATAAQPDAGILPPRTVAVLAGPRASNLDEFQPLANLPGWRLVWARSPAACAGADWLVLPGSKATAADLAWLRAQRLDAVVAEHAARGGAVLGICGGLQMLGEALVDPHGIDGNAPGLGLLPLVTVFAREKTVRHSRARFGAVAAGPWSALQGLEVAGYEIHHGQTAPHPAMAARGDGLHAVLLRDDGQPLGWQAARANVLGLYLHGLFEQPSVLQALAGARAPTLDAVFDGLADLVERHCDTAALRDMLM